MFHLWTWEKRVAEAAAVKALTELNRARNVSEKQHHEEVLSLLRKNLKSRQLQEPALGKLVQTATADPLHLMNAWEHLLTCILAESLALSSAPSSVHSTRTPSATEKPIEKLLSFIKERLHLNRLHRKLMDWYDKINETRTAETAVQSLQIRLNGLESRKFCQNVMPLLNCLLPAAKAQQEQSFLVRIHSLAFIALQLRDAVSLFSHYTISDSQVVQLKVKCRLYFNASVLFLPRNVTPTIWTIGHVVPEQTKMLKCKFGFGLGIGTTQGQEGKVQFAKKYLAHTTPANKYQLFFRHEYMHLVWLCVHDPADDSYHASKASYLPAGVDDDKCHCGQAKLDNSTKCDFCKHHFQTLIMTSAKEGVICPELIKILQQRMQSMLSY